MTRPDALSHAPQAVDTAVNILCQRFGERLGTGQSLREQHAHTTTWLPAQIPDAVFSPRNTQEVQEVVRVCAQHKVPIIGFGAGSSLEGHINAPSGGICLDFNDMSAILHVHPEDMDAVVQPGVTRKALNTHLRDTGLFFPVDPGADATLGGMAATRASGTNAVRYGTMKDVVLGLKVVLANGDVITTAKRARKTSAGYDLTRLMIGSEGTLGLITELTVKLFGIPEAESAARCSFPSVDAACNAVIATIQYGIPVARIELLDAATVRAVNAYSKTDLPEEPTLLLDFHGSVAAVAEQAQTFGEIAAEFGATGFDWTTDPAARAKLWQARHDTYWALLAVDHSRKGITTDVCVPVSRLAECVGAAQGLARQMGFEHAIVGHVGDGNFHVLLLVDTDSSEEIAKAESFIGQLNDLAIAMDGTCTGEHGIGQGKAKYLPRELGSETVSAMAAIKAALDPDNILNPGKLFQAL